MEALREFVGFVWWGDDFADQTGVLVEASDSAEAAAVLRDVYGDGVRVSVRNQEDAARPR